MKNWWNRLIPQGWATRPTNRRRIVIEVILAVAGVTLATGAIGFVLSWTHMDNISLLYLPVVLWLAARYGRGPAVLASVLSFLSYDFYFIPPTHLLTVDDPTEWLSLLALLATSLVLGHMTAVVRARARDAEESQRRTALLYRLAQMIAAATDERRLYEALAQEVVTVFAPSGARTCALLLPNESGVMEVVAQADRPPDSLGEKGMGTLHHDAPRRDADAPMLEATAGREKPMERHTRAGTPQPASGHLAAKQGTVAIRRELTGQQGVVGSLVLTGTPETQRLIAPVEEGACDEDTAEQRDLFNAICDQIALALDRAALSHQAAHVAALRESDRLKDALLGSVTHDLRTPLASIKAAASSLLQTDVSWSLEDQRELVESIDMSADRLNRLVSNLLDLSRLEAGVAQPELDWYLMSDVIAATIDQLELSGQAREREIRIEEPDDEPLLLMDHEQIQQVLTNLVENALKYTNPGGVIRIRVTYADGQALTQVIDQGVGIPPSERQMIFTKFYRVQRKRRADSSTRAPAGTGLGLAICENIVRAHSGRIWAEETPGGGATLAFTLPTRGTPPPGALPEMTVAAAPAAAPAAARAGETAAPRAGEAAYPRGAVTHQGREATV